MKRILLYNIVICSLLFTACKKDFLERASTTQLQDKDIFSSFPETDKVVNNLYSKLPKVYGYCGGFPLSSATDESKDASNWMSSMSFNSGGLSPTNNPIGNTWKHYYGMIRQANSILEGVKKYNTPDDPNNPGYLKNRIGEVYFLRATALSELVRQYGGVIIVTEVIQDPNDDKAIKKPRNTYDECVAQIAKDCDSAFKMVNTTYPSGQFGRVNKAACLALKSRMYLYAASPLYAISGKTTPFPDISDNVTATDATKWKKAADAAKAVIDFATGNLLEPTLEGRRKMFLEPWNSKEPLWVRKNDEDNSSGTEFERHFFPFGYGGWSAMAPTHNLVDDYEMKDGMSTKVSALYDPAKPYDNRDARLYYDILYNGVSFKGRNVETFTGGRDEQSTGTDHTRTGYFMRKLVDENITVGGGDKRAVDGMAFRLAEMYLNYAEALNEYAPGDPDIIKYLNMIRVRAGQPTVSIALSQADMRQKIRNERRIELCFENHRFWDVRRWKIAPFTESSIYGMRPVADASAPGGYRYEKFLVENRPWHNGMLAIPIPLDEIFRNDNLKQNPGW